MVFSKSFLVETAAGSLEDDAIYTPEDDHVDAPEDGNGDALVNDNSHAPEDVRGSAPRTLQRTRMITMATIIIQLGSWTILRTLGFLGVGVE